MRVVAALIVTAALSGGTLWADPPNGKGPKHQKHEKQKQAGKHDQADVQTMRFDGLDLNGDRVITRAEWRGNDASFRANDWNRDGVLSGDEVRPSARRPDQFFRKDWRGDLREFDKADLNHDGVLSAEEFARWR